MMRIQLDGCGDGLLICFYYSIQPALVDPFKPAVTGIETTLLAAPRHLQIPFRRGGTAAQSFGTQSAYTSTRAAWSSASASICARSKDGSTIARVFQRRLSRSARLQLQALRRFCARWNRECI
jgi:hypothetical protein